MARRDAANRAGAGPSRVPWAPWVPRDGSGSFLEFGPWNAGEPVQGAEGGDAASAVQSEFGSVGAAHRNAREVE